MGMPSENSRKTLWRLLADRLFRTIRLLHRLICAVFAQAPVRDTLKNPRGKNYLVLGSYGEFIASM